MQLLCESLQHCVVQQKLADILAWGHLGLKLLSQVITIARNNPSSESNLANKTNILVRGSRSDDNKYTIPLIR